MQSLLGNYGKALAALQEGCDEQEDLWITFMLRSSIFDPLRSDPRYTQVVKCFGIPP